MLRLTIKRHKMHLVALLMLSGLLLNTAMASPLDKVGFTMLPYRTLIVAKDPSDGKYHLIDNQVDPQTAPGKLNFYPGGAQPVVFTSGLDYSLSQGIRASVAPSAPALQGI